MNIEKILKDNNLTYELKKRKNIEIYNICDEKMLIVIQNDNNVFYISRKIFYEIDEELLPYAFCLIDSSKKQLYFVNINEPINFLRESFDNTEKENIYFGKQVLNNKIKEDDLIYKVNSIGK